MKHDHEHKPSPETMSVLGSVAGKTTQLAGAAFRTAFTAWTRAQGLHAAVGTLAMMARVDERFLQTLDLFELAEEYADYIRTGEAPEGMTEREAALMNVERLKGQEK